ncbi:MAG: TerB family tellurite resistance protein [Gemmatimonadota bacterium]
MHPSDAQPVATIAVMAALADGERSPAELEQLKRVATAAGGADVDALAAQVAAGTVTLADVAGQLSGSDAKQLVYEMAVAVCHADGAINARERAFLIELRGALALTDEQVREFEAGAAEIAGTPLTGIVMTVTPGSDPHAALDDTILNQAMLTGALELLPANLAALAIVPLQMRLVYQIGGNYGQKLDADQIKDLAGTFGLGAASQVMSGMAERVLGGVARGLLGRFLGGIAGGVAATAGGAMVTFASTYALGHAAKQYYAQGRRLSKADLQSLFTRFQEEAKTIYPKVQAKIAEQARGLSIPGVLGNLRGGLRA